MSVTIQLLPFSSPVVRNYVISSRWSVAVNTGCPPLYLPCRVVFHDYDNGVPWTVDDWSNQLLCPWGMVTASRRSGDHPSLEIRWGASPSQVGCWITSQNYYIRIDYRVTGILNLLLYFFLFVYLTTLSWFILELFGLPSKITIGYIDRSSWYDVDQIIIRSIYSFVDQLI